MMTTEMGIRKWFGEEGLWKMERGKESCTVPHARAHWSMHYWPLNSVTSNLVSPLSLLSTGAAQAFISNFLSWLLIVRVPNYYLHRSHSFLSSISLCSLQNMDTLSYVISPLPSARRNPWLISSSCDPPKIPTGRMWRGEGGGGTSWRDRHRR